MADEDMRIFHLPLRTGTETDAIQTDGYRVQGS
jgi:hypothetical protein